MLSHVMCVANIKFTIEFNEKVLAKLETHLEHEDNTFPTNKRPLSENDSHRRTLKKFL